MLGSSDESQRVWVAANRCLRAFAGGQFWRRSNHQEHHDLAGQTLKVQRSLGTPLQQDYSTLAFTDNGQQDWVEDAKGNRTEFVYDGFNRPCRMFLPVATVGAHAANIKDLNPLALDCTTLPTASAPFADYEQYGYDPNGNRTSILRRRGSDTVANNTITYTFDAVNRETRKNLPVSDTFDVHTRYERLIASCSCTLARRPALSAPAAPRRPTA